MADVVVRNGTLVMSGMPPADIAIEDGRIQRIGPELPANGAGEIDARGLHVFPGLIDVHLHFNEPGRAEWEGAETGSRALAAGGGTLYFDMPLNSTPCTVNAGAFDRKCAALKAASLTDFGLWGGLVPDNLGELAELAAKGVVGFKAFLCDSGLPEFPRADDLTLFEGLREAARLGLPVAVHAESHELVQGLSRRMAEKELSGVRDFLASRPVLAELEAIQRATLLAGEAGAKLHIVHVSSGRGVALAAEARARGVDVSIETCPHYLYLYRRRRGTSGGDRQVYSSLARRRRARVPFGRRCSAAWLISSRRITRRRRRKMKSADFARAWGGIAGVQSTLAVLLDRGYRGRSLPLERIASMTAAEPARRF